MASGDQFKRAETTLRIAQLKLKQSLKKEEDVRSTILPAVSLESSAQFCDHLDAVLQQNTPSNVQVSNLSGTDQPSGSRLIATLGMQEVDFEAHGSLQSPHCSAW